MDESESKAEEPKEERPLARYQQREINLSRGPDEQAVANGLELFFTVHGLRGSDVASLINDRLTLYRIIRILAHRFNLFTIIDGARRYKGTHKEQKITSKNDGKMTKQSSEKTVLNYPGFGEIDEGLDFFGSWDTTHLELKTILAFADKGGTITCGQQ